MGSKPSINGSLIRLKDRLGVESDAELARLLDIPASTVANWKSRGAVPLSVCVQAATEHGVSLDWLILGKETAAFDADAAALAAEVIADGAVFLESAPDANKHGLIRGAFQKWYGEFGTALRQAGPERPRSRGRDRQDAKNDPSGVRARVHRGRRARCGPGGRGLTGWDRPIRPGRLHSEIDRWKREYFTKMKLDAKAIEKIWNLATDRVLPSFLTPRGTKLRGIARADARAHEIRAMAQAEKDAEDIRQGRAHLDRSGQLVRRPPSEGTMSYRSLPDSPTGAASAIEVVRATADIRDLQRFINLTRAISLALDEAEKIPDERVSDDPVDPDWFAAWREGAERVSNEEMRVFWARILAGETKQPDSYSLHTIEVLRRLSRADAKQIEEVAPLVVSNEIPRLEETFDLVSTKKLLELSEMGMLTGVETTALSATYLSMTEECFEHHLVCNDKVLIVVAADSKKKLSFPCIKITRVGQEIISLGQFQANVTFIEKFASTLKTAEFDVKLGDLDRGTEEITNVREV